MTAHDFGESKGLQGCIFIFHRGSRIQATIKRHPFLGNTRMIKWKSTYRYQRGKEMEADTWKKD
jgi:hypothetical protein